MDSGAVINISAQNSPQLCYQSRCPVLKGDLKIPNPNLNTDTIRDKRKEVSAVNKDTWLRVFFFFFK